MKTNRIDKSQTNDSNACSFNPSALNHLKLCRKIVDRLEDSKNAIESKFRHAVSGQEHLLHLAMNEAEALAWETGLPHLFFPALAVEKAQAVASWSTRQRSIQGMNDWQAFAA